MITTRVMTGSKKTAGNIVFSKGDCLLTANVNWKPLVSFELVTCTLCNASMTACAAVTGTAGPLINDRSTPLSIRSSGNSFRQSDAQLAPDCLRQLFRSHRGIGIGNAPKHFRIIHVFGSDVVEALVLSHDVFEQQLEPFGGRHEPA